METRKPEANNTCHESPPWPSDCFWTVPSSQADNQNVHESIGSPYATTSIDTTNCSISGALVQVNSPCTTTSVDTPNSPCTTTSVDTTNCSVSGALGKVIRTRRRSLGISQQTLAEVTGLDRGYLISIEHAKRNPSITTLLHIAAGLRVRASELLHQAEEAANRKN